MIRSQLKIHVNFSHCVCSTAYEASVSPKIVKSKMKMCKSKRQWSVRTWQTKSWQFSQENEFLLNYHLEKVEQIHILTINSQRSQWTHQYQQQQMLVSTVHSIWFGFKATDTSFSIHSNIQLIKKVLFFVHVFFIPLDFFPSKAVKHSSTMKIQSIVLKIFSHQNRDFRNWKVIKCFCV